VNGHTFVDETKHRDYLLVAGVIIPGDLDPLRKAVRGLVLPGQRRLHMNAENDSRRKAIAAMIVDNAIQATIYDAGRRYSTERDRRAACLQALVGDAARRGDVMLILEQDDTLVSWDNRHLNPSWIISPVEDSLLATDFIAEAIERNGAVPHTVHADRGTSMTSKPVSALTHQNIFHSRLDTT